MFNPRLNNPLYQQYLEDELIHEQSCFVIDALTSYFGIVAGVVITFSRCRKPGDGGPSPDVTERKEGRPCRVSPHYHSESFEWIEFLTTSLMYLCARARSCHEVTLFSQNMNGCAIQI